MNNESSAQRILQDVSTIIAAILPLAQLFFTSLPAAFTQILHAKEQFTGISLVTLILSYTLIIAYHVRPWATLTLPFQKKRREKYDHYLRKLSEESTAKTFALSSQSSIVEAKVETFLRNLEKAPVKPPLQIGQSNIVAVTVISIFITAITFVTIGLIERPGIVLTIVQSVCYIFLVSLTALMLTLYYKTSQGNRKNEEDQRLRTARAIDLATSANCFGDIPQVKFISSFNDEQGAALNYRVWVEYEGQKYEIVTDFRARKLVAVYPFDSDGES